MYPLSSQFVALSLLMIVEVMHGARPAEEQLQNLVEGIDPLTGNLVLDPIGYQNTGNGLGGSNSNGGGSNSNGGGGSNSNGAQQVRVDKRRFAALDDAAAMVGEKAGVMFNKLLNILTALGAFLFVLLLAVLAAVYIDKVLKLFGVSENYVYGAIFIVDLFILVGGLFFALEILHIDPGEIFIGMGLLSYAAVGVVGKTATEIFQGFSVKIDSSYDVGQEISVLSNRYRGIVHSRKLTEIVFDLQSPLLPEGQRTPAVVRQPVMPVTPGAPVMIEEVEEFRYLRMSYSQFFGEERIFHKYHRQYVPAPLRKRGNMGIHLENGSPTSTRNRDD